MISTISKQGGRRRPQIGSTATIFVGRLPSVGTSSGVAAIIPLTLILGVVRPELLNLIGINSNGTYL